MAAKREREREGSATLAFLLPSVMVLKEKERRGEGGRERRPESGLRRSSAVVTRGNFVLSSDSRYHPGPNDMGLTNSLIMTGSKTTPNSSKAPLTCTGDIADLTSHDYTHANIGMPRMYIEKKQSKIGRRIGASQNQRKCEMKDVHFLTLFSTTY